MAVLSKLLAIHARFTSHQVSIKSHQALSPSPWALSFTVIQGCGRSPLDFDELAHRQAHSRDGVPQVRRHAEKHTVERTPLVAEEVGAVEERGPRERGLSHVDYESVTCQLRASRCGGRARPTRAWSAGGARLQG
jgi:hypothetical protein